MRDFDRREREALDRFITGNYGEDQCPPVNDVDDDSDPEALNDFDQRTEIDDDFDNDFNIHS